MSIRTTDLNQTGIFLNTPTSEQIGITKENYFDVPTLDRGDSTKFTNLENNKKLKAEKKKIYTTNSKNKILFMTQEALHKNQHIIAECSHRDANKLLAKLQTIIKTQQSYNVDMIQAYKNDKRLGQLFALVGRGVISLGRTADRFTASTGNVTNKHKILLLSSRQATDGKFNRIGRYSGIYLGKPAITQFSIKAINELDKYIPMKVEGDTLAKKLIKAYSVKKMILADKNDLTKETSGVISDLTDEEIADGVSDGTITKEQCKEQLEASRIHNINKLLKI